VGASNGSKPALRPASPRRVVRKPLLDAATQRDLLLNIDLLRNSRFQTAVKTLGYERIAAKFV
jgi:hypothetical protein